MRALLTLLILSTIILSFGQQPEKIYKTKSGRISYSFDINGMQSTYNLVFDDYGTKHAFEYSIINQGINEKSKTIITPANIYIVNYVEKNVIKMPYTNDENDTYDAGNGFDLGKIAIEVENDISKKTGTEQLLNKTCDVFVYTDGVNKGKYWVWNGILMKADFYDQDGTHIFIETKELKTDVSIPASEFEPPTGFAIVDMTQTMDQLQMMFEMQEEE